MTRSIRITLGSGGVRTPKVSWSASNQRLQGDLNGRQAIANRPFLALLLLASCLLCPSAAFSAQIIADASDFEVFSSGVNDDAAGLGDFGVGDTGGGSPNLGRRALVRFSLAGLSGQTVTSAMLSLFLIETRRDQYPDPGMIDDFPPFINPGLGDLLALHVPDYGSPNPGAYGTPSIGNDPGVLVFAGFQPGDQVSIGIRDAMQQAINAGLPFVTFRLQTAIETDGDGLNDVWFFASANNPNLARRPFVEFTVIPEPSTIVLLVCGIAARFVRRTLVKSPRSL